MAAQWDPITVRCSELLKAEFLNGKKCLRQLFLSIAEMRPKELSGVNLQKKVQIWIVH